MKEAGGGNQIRMTLSLSLFQTRSMKTESIRHERERVQGDWNKYRRECIRSDRVWIIINKRREGEKRRWRGRRWWWWRWSKSWCSSNTKRGFLLSSLSWTSVLSFFRQYIIVLSRDLLLHLLLNRSLLLLFFFFFSLSVIVSLLFFPFIFSWSSSLRTDADLIAMSVWLMPRHVSLLHLASFLDWQGKYTKHTLDLHFILFHHQTLKKEGKK